jgi:DNA modification methylase
MTTQRIIPGDCIAGLRTLPHASVHCCVTSPPYWGLRDYGHAGQIGLEETPERYVARMVDVFRDVRRVLRDDGTLWLNLGDSYGKGKQLLGMPWKVASALQSDGWILRQDIIWHKPNPMPESVRDRCTKAHEYVFLFAKAEKYFYDADAIRQPLRWQDPLILATNAQARQQKRLSERISKGDLSALRTESDRRAAMEGKREKGRGKDGNRERTLRENLLGANRRSVWTITTKPFSGAHFAVMPAALVEKCIKAGCPEGGTVLEPFAGSGTTLAVAAELGRNAIGCELNPEYIKLAEARIMEARGKVALFESVA